MNLQLLPTNGKATKDMKKNYPQKGFKGLVIHQTPAVKIIIKNKVLVLCFLNFNVRSDFSISFLWQ